MLTVSLGQILDSSKVSEFADDNFKFDENGRQFTIKEKRPVKRTLGKCEIACYPFPTVFSRFELEENKNLSFG